MDKFYKSRTNGRVLFGNNNLAIELVGPNGTKPNFKSIRWSLSGYDVLESFKISYSLENCIEHIHELCKEKESSFVILVSDEIRPIESKIFYRNRRSIIFFKSPHNKSFPYIIKENSNYSLKLCNEGTFRSYLKRQENNIVTEDWITLSKVIS